MFTQEQKDPSSCYDEPSVGGIIIGYVLIVGITISYLPQVGFFLLSPHVHIRWLILRSSLAPCGHSVYHIISIKKQ